MRTFLALILLSVSPFAKSQDLKRSVDAAIKALQHDQQLKHATISFCLAEVGSNKFVYSLNGESGVAPASVQKIITSASAFEILGPDYIFQTIVGYSGTLINGVINGNLYIKASGDPSFGSWRWASTTREKILARIVSILRQNKITIIRGQVMIEDSPFPSNPVPNGWIWEDIGNYYGAGAWGLNWYENQYDLHFMSPGKLNAETKILYTRPFDLTKQIRNYVRTSSAGSGDNTIIFTAPFSEDIFVTGTIPLGDKNFIVKGAVPDPKRLFLKELDSVLEKAFVRVEKGNITNQVFTAALGRIESPRLDSINYWFLQKSINLYGESLLNAIAKFKQRPASASEGIKIITDYWKGKGIDPTAPAMLDGSGLSPGNRITAKSLVQILLFARQRGWYQSFFSSLPLMNGIKMKDGYISGVRSYAGYITNNGKEYCFSFVVNNYTGSASSVRTKMYKVLDLLK